MAKKYLYGNLNQDTVRPNYGGSTTDSLVINVDNDKMIISGEVKWDAALGELAHTAYPGDKGARNYNKIQELTAQLEEEIARAAKSRSSVESKVGQLENSVKALDTTLTTAIRTEAAIASEADSIILQQCRNEAERAIAEEAKLLAQLKAEALARENVDTEVLKRLDALSGLSSDCIEELHSIILAEQTRAVGVEKQLQQELDSEIARAAQSETEIISSVNKVAADLRSEVARIDASIVAEQTNCAIAHDSVTELVEVESTRAQEAEDKLNEDILALHTTLSSLESAFQQLVEKSTNSSNVEIQAELENIRDELEVVKQETSHGFSELEKEISKLETTQITNEKEVAKQLRSLTQSVSLNTDLVSKLSGKLRDINAQLASLDVSIRDTQASVAHEATQRQASDVKIEKSITTLDTKADKISATLNSQIEIVDSKTTKLANSIQLVDSAVKEINVHVQQLVAADLITAEEFNQLNEQLKTVYNNIGVLRADIDAEVTRAQSAEKNLEQKLIEVKEESNVTSTLIQSLTAALQSVKETVSALTIQLEQNQSMDESTAQDIMLLQSDIQSLRNELESRSVQYEETLNNVVQRINVTDEQLAFIQPQIDGLKTTINLIQTNLGSLTIDYNRIVAGFEQLDNTIETLDDRISGVQDQLDNTTSRIDSTLEDHRVALVKHDISTHQHDVDIADLQTAILRLDNQDDSLDEKISAVDASRAADSNLHIEHYHELVSRLEQEIKRAIAADESLLIDTDRNSGRITSLQLDLTNVISKYVQELTQADAALDDKISYEHNLSDEYRAKILDEVNDVAQESLQRDNALQAQIEIINGKKDSVPLIENDGELPELYAQQGDKTFTIPVEKAVVPESVIRRDSVGNVILSTDTDAFTTHSAVSKLFVDNIVSELRKEIGSLSFDFIDGGNAPIG